MSRVDRNSITEAIVTEAVSKVMSHELLLVNEGTINPFVNENCTSVINKVFTIFIVVVTWSRNNNGVSVGCDCSTKHVVDVTVLSPARQLLFSVPSYYTFACFVATE
ncbi:hypothetical protein D3C87_835250 [compost metagenome]